MTLSTAEAVLSLYSWGWKRTFSLKIHFKFNKVSHKSIRILTVALLDSLPVHKVQACTNTAGCNFNWPYLFSVFPSRESCHINFFSPLADVLLTKWVLCGLHWDFIFIGFNMPAPSKCTDVHTSPVRHPHVNGPSDNLQRQNCWTQNLLPGRRYFKTLQIYCTINPVFNTVSIFFNTCFSKSSNPMYRIVFREPEMVYQSQPQDKDYSQKKKMFGQSVVFTSHKNSKEPGEKKNLGQSGQPKNWADLYSGKSRRAGSIPLPLERWYLHAVIVRHYQNKGNYLQSFILSPDLHFLSTSQVLASSGCPKDM